MKRTRPCPVSRESSPDASKYQALMGEAQREPEEVLYQPQGRGVVKEGSWEVVPEQILEEEKQVGVKQRKSTSSEGNKYKVPGARELLYLYPKAFLEPTMDTISPYSVGCPPSSSQFRDTP